MKIALDTRDLGFATTGTRTYLQELLFALRAQQKEGVTLIELSGMQWGTSRFSSAFLTKFIQQLSLLLWKQVVLPLRCRAAKADVLICTDYFLPLLPCGAKKIVVFHDALFFDMPENYPRLWLLYFKALYLPAAHRASAIVTPSFFSRDRLLYHFPFWSQKLKVIYQGPKVLPEQGAISPNGERVMQLLQGKPFFLHVGVFEKRKNILFLLEAFATFARRFDVKLLLIGSSNGKLYSDDAANIHRYIQAHQLQDRVILAGYLPDADLAFFYRQAKAYIYPSVYEGFGIPLLEAFTNGLPVASASGSALEEVAADASIYFDPRTKDSLVDCMERLHTDELLRSQLIAKGYQRVGQFRWTDLVKDFIALAKSL